MTLTMRSALTLHVSRRRLGGTHWTVRLSRLARLFLVWVSQSFECVCTVRFPFMSRWNEAMCWIFNLRPSTLNEEQLLA